MNIGGADFEENRFDGIDIEIDCVTCSLTWAQKWELFRWILNTSVSGKPPIGETVIVAGGLAKWTGECWLSQTPDSMNRPIQWEVNWWLPLLY